MMPLPASPVLDLPPFAESFQRIVVGADPGAGSEISVSVPGEGIWELYAVLFSLTTSATAGNRWIRLTCNDGRRDFLRIPSSQAQGAGGTTNYLWAAGLGATVADGVDTIAFSLPPGLLLEAGWLVETDTNFLQVGDDFSAPTLFLRQYVRRGERSQLEYELLNALRRLLAVSEYLPAGGE